MLSREEIKKSLIDEINQNIGRKSHLDFSYSKKNIDINKSLLKPDNDLLGFLIEYGKHYEDWQIDILNIGIQSLGLNDINKFNISDKIIEYKYEDKNFYSEDSINSFINKISNPTPTPGGGSVAALTGALASALSSMVANLTINKKGFENKYNYLNDRSINTQKHIEKLIRFILTNSYLKDLEVSDS